MSRSFHYCLYAKERSERKTERYNKVKWGGEERREGERGKQREERRKARVRQRGVRGRQKHYNEITDWLVLKTH